MARYAFAALAVAVALPARAGVILKYQDNDKKQTTLEIEGKKLRSSPQGTQHEGNSVIFDGDSQVFYSLDDESKTYRRMDQASGAEMGNKMKDAMEKAKAKMTPEQRAQLDALMAGQQQPARSATPKAHAWKFERTTGSQKVAGYSCDNYRVLRDGMLESEVCFVPWSAGAFRRDDFLAFREMGRFFEKTFASMGERLGRSARHSPSEDWVAHFVDDAPGFPGVMDRLDEHGKRTREMRLITIERKSVAASEFAPPPGYREQKNRWGGGE